MAAGAGFEKEMLITDMRQDERMTVEEPLTLQLQLPLAGDLRFVTAVVTRLEITGQNVLLAVFTAIREPGALDNDTVSALCDIFAAGHKNALRAFLQASAVALGAFSAAVYEKRKERYVIREEWRERRAVSIRYSARILTFIRSRRWPASARSSGPRSGLRALHQGARHSRRSGLFL
jgi:hypothetical protein